MPERDYTIRLAVKGGNTSAAQKVEKQMQLVAKATERVNKAIAGKDSKEGAKAFRQLEGTVADLRQEIERLTASQKKSGQEGDKASERTKKGMKEAAKEARAFDRDVQRLLKSLEQTERGAGAAGGQLERGGKGAKNFGMAVLEGSRALEDMQYGIRGVVNNIPGLVLSLGGGAGLAGVISVAVVALVQLGGALASAGDKLDSSRELAELAAEALREVRKEAAALAREEMGTRLEESLQAQVNLVERYNQRVQDQLQLQQAQAEAEERIAAARRKSARAEILASQMGPAEREAALAELDRQEGAAGAASRLRPFENQVANAQGAIAGLRRSLGAQQIGLADAEREETAAREGVQALQEIQPAVERLFAQLAAVRKARQDAGAIGDLVRGTELAKEEGVITGRLRALTPFRNLEGFQGSLGIAQERLQAAQGLADPRRQEVAALQQRIALLEQDLQAARQRAEIERGAVTAEQRADEQVRLLQRSGALDATQRGALQNLAGQTGSSGLQGILNDAIPDSAQAQQIVGVLQVLSGEYAARDQEVFRSILELIALVQRTQQEQRAIQQQLEALRAAQ